MLVPSARTRSWLLTTLPEARCSRTGRLERARACTWVDSFVVVLRGSQPLGHKLGFQKVVVCFPCVPCSTLPCPPRHISTLAGRQRCVPFSIRQLVRSRHGRGEEPPRLAVPSSQRGTMQRRGTALGRRLCLGRGAAPPWPALALSVLCTRTPGSTATAFGLTLHNPQHHPAAPPLLALAPLGHAEPACAAASSSPSPPSSTSAS